MEREVGTHIRHQPSTPVEAAAAKLEELYGADSYTLAWAVLKELRHRGFRLVGPGGDEVDLHGLEA